MANGIVKWFDCSRGFGYITPDDGGDDLFVHHTGIAAPLDDGYRVVEPGARVEFEMRAGDRGPEAVNVAAPGLGRNGRRRR